jgi:S-adenosylmethionine-diacylglycerol 3-amino-3-carboxypropyl transferase
MLHLTAAAQRATATRLAAAVHRNRMFSREGVLERIFTLAFRGLVYPQIWEDPAVDLEALQIRPTDHVLAIGSGGCNILNYLVADPARISAIDLNGAHIALIRLKLCALRHLPDYDSFFRFFGSADCHGNLVAYDRYVRPHLDLGSRRYWEARTITGRRRIESFTRNFYRYGLLGRCIGMGHLLARLYGCNPRDLLQANSMQEQRAIFDRELAPIFDKRFVRWLFNQPAALYGLGIPPSQHRSLAGTIPTAWRGFCGRASKGWPATSISAKITSHRRPSGGATTPAPTPRCRPIWNGATTRASRAVAAASASFTSP